MTPQSNKIKTRTKHSSFWLDRKNRNSTMEFDPVQYSQILRSVGNFVHIVTGEDYKVRFVRSGADSCANPKDGVQISADLDNLDAIVGTALHEGSHLLLSTYYDEKTPKGTKPQDSKFYQYKVPGRLKREIRNKYPIFANDEEKLAAFFFMTLYGLLNWVEDRRIDAWQYRNAPGYQGYYDEFYKKYWYSSHIDKMLKSDVMREEKWDCYLSRIINIHNKNTDFDALKGLKEIWEVIDLKNIERLKSTDDALDVAIKMFEIVEKYVGVPEQEDEMEEDDSSNMPIPMPMSGESSGDSDDGDCETQSSGGSVDDFLKGKEPKKSSTGDSNSDEEDENDGNKDDNNGDEEDENDGNKDESDGDDDGNNDESDGDDDGNKDDGNKDEGDESDGDDDGDNSIPDINEDDYDENGDPIEKPGNDPGDSVDDLINDEKTNPEEMPGDDLTPDEKRRLVKNIKKQIKTLLGEMEKESLSQERSEQVEQINQAKTEVKDTGGSTSAGNLGKIDTVVIKNFTKEFIRTDPFDLFSYGIYDKETINTGIKLGKKLAKKLVVQAEEKTTIYNRKPKGKIDKRMIYSAGFENENLFFQNETEVSTDTFIYMSIDGSGSMSGGKFRSAQITAVALAYCSEVIPGFNIVITYRYTYDSGSSYHSAKPLMLVAFDSRVDDFTKVKKLFPYLGAVSYTPEGLCFEAIQKDIVESNRNMDVLFINISDGMPYFTYSSGSNYFHYDGAKAIAHTRREVEHFWKKGIEVLSFFVGGGFGGHDTAFKTMYGKDATFIDPTNLGQLAMSLNKKFLRKRKI